MTRRALVVANDLVGSTMTGPGLRSYRLALELARDFDVTLVVPFETDLADGRLEVVADNPWDPARMSALSRDYDVVLAQRLPIPTMRKLADARTFVVYDLYAPLTIEQLALDAREERSTLRGSMAQMNELTQSVVLATGDAFLCASERQRDFWLGALANAGRLDADAYRRDASLRSLIEVVPFGIDPEPPTPGPAIRGVVPGIGAGDRVLLWPGGIWNWFDPLTVIQAVDALAPRHPDLRLYFLGIRHPTPGVPGMPHAAMAEQAVALAETLGLRDRHVFFNDGWVPYSERGRYLLDADLAVSAQFDDVETRLAFRTRLLDCLWAGLPVVTTRGDTLGDELVASGAGFAVEPGDVAGWTETLERVLEHDDLRRRSPRRSRQTAPALRMVAGRRAAARARRGAGKRLPEAILTGRSRPLRCAPAADRRRPARHRRRCREAGRASRTSAEAVRTAGTLSPMAAPARAASSAGADVSQRLRHNLRIVHVLAALDFKLKYAGSALGYVWSVVKPLALFTMLYLVFGRIFDLGRDLAVLPALTPDRDRPLHVLRRSDVARDDVGSGARKL